MLSIRPKDFKQSTPKLVAALIDHHQRMLSFRLASSSDSSIPTSRQNFAARPTSDFEGRRGQAKVKMPEFELGPAIV
jgi:hypothetical protein